MQVADFFVSETFLGRLDDTGGRIGANAALSHVVVSSKKNLYVRTHRSN
jgi:hypothetical protein